MKLNFSSSPKNDKEQSLLNSYSFYSNFSNNLSENDPATEGDYKEYRNTSKHYLGIFRDHINNEDHPINMISKYFINVFTDFIEEKMILIEKNSNNHEFSQFSEFKCEEITKQLQKFIVKLQFAVRLFYCKTNNYQYFVNEKDEFITIVTNLLLSDITLYKYIYSLYEITILEKLEKLRLKMIELKKVNPQDLGIHDKFSLNQLTVNYQKKMIIDLKNKE